MPADAPPLFLLHAADDEMAWKTGMQWGSAWRAAGRSVEMHVFSRGGHGFGMNRKGFASDGWIDRFPEWLKTEGLLGRG